MHIAIYEMMEGCTGISGDPDRVHWSMAWSIEDAETGEIKASMWSGTDGYRQIILAKEWAFSGHYISHEVLHDLYDGPAPMDTAMRCLFFWWNLREARP
ncbi:MAG: hypothetical protein GWN53_17360 [Gammaproteobacteria bacterium]|nr:hypothetical protein [Gammaproteobacteria bacterium]